MLPPPNEALNYLVNVSTCEISFAWSDPEAPDCPLFNYNTVKSWCNQCPESDVTDNAPVTVLCSVNCTLSLMEDLMNKHQCIFALRRIGCDQDARGNDNVTFIVAIPYTGINNMSNIFACHFCMV